MKPPEVDEEEIEKIGILEFQCFPPSGRRYRCLRLGPKGKMVEVYSYETGKMMMISFPIKPITFKFYPVWVKYPDGTEQILDK